MRIQQNPSGWWVVEADLKRGPYTAAMAMQVGAAMAATRTHGEASMRLIEADGSERACRLGTPALDVCSQCGSDSASCPLIGDARRKAER